MSEYVPKKKHAGGRPLKIKSPAKLKEKIEVYFEKCKENKVLPTFAGLAYEMEIDRHTLFNYSVRPLFVPIIKKAVNYITACIEHNLLNNKGNIVGTIFLAKNYGYFDKQEIEHSGDVNINIKGLAKL